MLALSDWNTGIWIAMAVMMAAMFAVILAVAWLFVRPFSFEKRRRQLES